MTEGKKALPSSQRSGTISGLRTHYSTTLVSPATKKRKRPLRKERKLRNHDFTYTVTGNTKNLSLATLSYTLPSSRHTRQRYSEGYSKARCDHHTTTSHHTHPEPYIRTRGAQETFLTTHCITLDTRLSWNGNGDRQPLEV